jgi:hypothetical protein
MSKPDDEVADRVVTLRDPQLNGGDLTYNIKVIQGKLPEKGGPGAVFIDIIGMPLTPISYVGGFSAHRGTLKLLPWVILAGFVGNSIQNQAYFVLGRRYGTRTVDKHPDWKSRHNDPEAEVRALIKTWRK